MVENPTIGEKFEIGAELNSETGEITINTITSPSDMEIEELKADVVKFARKHLPLTIAGALIGGMIGFSISFYTGSK